MSKLHILLRTYWAAAQAVRRQKDREGLVAVQNAKLQRLVRFAVREVKYYQELFEYAGIDTDTIRTAADLAAMPLLNKQQVRDRFWDFLPGRLGPCRVSRTSGSTGVPLCLLSDESSRVGNSAAVICYRRALGIPFFGGAIITPLKTVADPPRGPHWTYLQGLHRTWYVNPYAKSDREMGAARSVLEKLRNPIVIGITPALAKLAYGVCDGILPRFNAQVVITTGVVLVPEVRELLAETFGAPVADVYACNEGGDVAWQCMEEKNYHVNMDNVIVEILCDGRAAVEGEVGEVIITNLNRYAMPLIRYRTGDLARVVSETCPCGCQLPLLGEIMGRTGEDVTLPGGGIVPWHQLKGLMNHALIRRFQLVQETDGALRVKYVAEPNAAVEGIESVLRQRFLRLLGAGIGVKYERVEDIAPEASGKNKLVVSHYRGK